MKMLEPSLVASLPETAVLDLVAGALETAIVALLAVHPSLDRGSHPAGCCSHNDPSACCLADAIIELIYQLDNAIIHYRDFVEAELEAEQLAEPPF